VRLVQPTLRIRMALLYGALVLLIGAALLATSYILLDRALTQIALPNNPGDVTITDNTTHVQTVWNPSQARSVMRSDALHYLLNNGLLYFGVIVLIGSIGGYLLARQALRPVARITATAKQLSTKTLNERIGLGGPDDELRELADTNRAQRLVDALLALARLQGREGQGLELSEPVVLNELIPNAVAAARAEAVVRGISITAEGEPVSTTGDPRLLERVIGNLVENAVRYNVPGGWVKIETESEGAGSLRVSKIIVTNSGVSVRPDEVEGLFDAFRRGGRARTGQRGAGLGLSIVRAIVDAHNGAIEAEALPAGGLRVAIALPATVVQPASLIG
jgi:signal transduction histidine kinase